MNPRSSARLDTVEKIAVSAALRPLETATSDSAICRDTTETSAGETRSRTLSTIVAIASSACLYELDFESSSSRRHRDLQPQTPFLTLPLTTRGDPDDIQRQGAVVKRTVGAVCSTMCLPREPSCGRPFARLT